MPLFGGPSVTRIQGGRIDTIREIKTVGEIKKVSEVSRVKDVSIKALPCPKIDDKGFSIGWTLAKGLAIAVAAYATYKTWKAANDQYKLAKKYYNLAKEQWDHFEKTYRPLEDKELDEIHAEQPYLPDYPGQKKGHTNLIDKMFAEADRHRVSLADKYCVCADVGGFVKAEIMMSTVYGDSDNFSRRYAEKAAQEKNDIRWSRRVAAATRGRGLLPQSASLASKALGFLDDYAKAWSGVAQGAMTFLGYANNRNRTVYPSMRERIDGRAPVPDTYRGFDADGYWAARGIPTTEADSGGLVWGGYSTPPMQSGFDPAQPMGVTNAQLAAQGQ